MSAQAALEYAREKQCALWELAAHYEETISGKTRSSIVTMMTEIVQIMRESALKGIAGEGVPRGFLGPSAGKMEKNIHLAGTKLLDMGVLNEVMVWATAVMEYDIRRGRVVAAPTGGSCGVLPAAVVLLGEKMGKTDEEIAKALVSAGLVGVFIDHFATFAAEICGCQAENGAAGSMAAAGVVDLLGGNPEEAFAASSLALQNILGMICDPVAGVGNVPCVSRNALSAVNAILSANMVLNGFDPFVPLDETIQAMMEVGRLMPEEHRCTARGGLCVTPSALRAQKLVERPLE
jgi:L-serine dehydratase